MICPHDTEVEDRPQRPGTKWTEVEEEEVRRPRTTTEGDETERQGTVRRVEEVGDPMVERYDFRKTKSLSIH